MLCIKNLYLIDYLFLYIDIFFVIFIICYVVVGRLGVCDEKDMFINRS